MSENDGSEMVQGVGFEPVKLRVSSFFSHPLFFPFFGGTCCLVVASLFLHLNFFRFKIINTVNAMAAIRGRIIQSERSRIEDEAVGFIVVDRVGVGKGVGTGWFRLAAAWGFAAVKNGIKVTVPKLAS